MAALAALCASGCISNPNYRPCGPGFMNNIFVPQGCAGVDFRRACQRHDDCYGAGCDRKACDQQFYNDMLDACRCSPLPCICRLRAMQWYVQVRLFGGMGYGGGSCGNPGCIRCQQQSCGNGCGTSYGCCPSCGTPACGCGDGCYAGDPSTIAPPEHAPPVPADAAY